MGVKNLFKVVNVYMAKAPGDVTSWDGSGAVWFKVHEISAVTNGGTSISWPSTSNILSISMIFPLIDACFLSHEHRHFYHSEVPPFRPISRSHGGYRFARRIYCWWRCVLSLIVRSYCL